MSTAIGRRVDSALSALESYARTTDVKDVEAALTQTMIAIDATASKLTFGLEHRARLTAFFERFDILITGIGMDVPGKGYRADSLKLSDVFYALARCMLLHEGQLQDLVEFGDFDATQMRGGPRWRLPVEFIYALIIAVVVCPDNRVEVAPTDRELTFLDTQRRLSELWGEEVLVKRFLQLKFGRA